MHTEAQDINGILLLNKPRNYSSNAALQQVKKLYNAKKAGHTGSLDPLATGMLPICFGRATKSSQQFLNADKFYEVTGLLGIKTDTGDVHGQVIREVSKVNITASQLTTAINQFKGAGQQIPPMFAAIKHKGLPLYKYARRGITIERKPRAIIIHKLLMTHFDHLHFTLQVLCSKGTYIRSLIADLGDLLGVGAHVTYLHRIYTAGFANAPMFTLAELKSKSVSERHSLLLSLEPR